MVFSLLRRLKARISRFYGGIVKNCYCENLIFTIIIRIVSVSIRHRALIEA